MKIIIEFEIETDEYASNVESYIENFIIKLKYNIKKLQVRVYS